MQIMSSGPQEWEHVSVTVLRARKRGKPRTPTWKEMCLVKSLFWDDDETVVQFHPKVADYVNVHPNRLHLWKRRGAEYELPPRELLA